ncbi:MAG: amidophosphoribosyltransferase [bacterium]
MSDCGVFGIYGHPEASIITYMGLYALQHRGQESAGIATSDGSCIYLYKAMGEVRQVFEEADLYKLVGSKAIGHVRYSTTGTSTLDNAQPIKIDRLNGSMAIAHNGNIVNAFELRKKLEKLGAIFHSSSDSEIILHLITKSKAKSNIVALIDALKKVRGAYSVIYLDEDHLIGARDPNGFRPLCLGRMDGVYLFASESCAFDMVGAKYIRDVETGEVVIISKRGIESRYITNNRSNHLCIFEYIYFLRPDSNLEYKSVYQVRKNLGKILAREKPAKADIVIPIPDSSNCAALGYAEESGIPFEFGLIRSHYVGRTFIEPSQKTRDFDTRIKYNAVNTVLNGKSVVVVDDSIVRGTTSRNIVDMLRRAGASEIHFRVSSPPITHPCFYGIDTPTREELIASSHSVDEIAEFIGVDTLGYLSIDGLLNAVGGRRKDHCVACFTGKYPVCIPEEVGKEVLEKDFIRSKIF